MSTKTGSILAAICGLLGAIMLGLSFSLNVGPPSDATTSAQLIAFDHQNFALILWGAWLQAISPVFIVLFAFRIVTIAGATSRIAGWMTLFGASILMTVSLIEIVFYVSALYDTPSTMAPISYELIHSVQHLYFIVASPAFFIPLGFVILGSDVLPRLLGYLAILLGVAFAIAGIVTLFSFEVSRDVQLLAILQLFWWLAAAITLIVRAVRTSTVVKEQTA